MAQVERLRNFFREHPVGGEPGEGPVRATAGRLCRDPPPAPASGLPGRGFRDALADDFNTPRAMAEVFELVGEANRGEVSGSF